jgi:hypothetical protein
VKGIHICSFRGTRIVEPPGADAKGPRVKCEGDGKRGKGCSKVATVGILFAWGVAGMCAECATEECGPGSPGN